MADGTLKVGTITTSSGSGTITIPSGVSLSGGVANTPSFMAYNGSAYSISNATLVKARLNTEAYDTDNAFDSSTNYRFTVPSGAAGKYAISYGTEARSTGNDIYVSEAYLYKNGSQVAAADINNNTLSVAGHRSLIITRSICIELAVGDYLEVYAYVACDSPPTNFPQLESASNTQNTFMSGYKLIGA
jgi:hypothetical protein